MNPYDANTDWVAPKADDGDPEINIARWKFDALLRGAFNRSMQQISEMARADDADSAGASELGYETKPPPLAADAEEPSPVDPEWIEAIDKAVDALTARVGALEKRRAAEAALTALEDEIERMLPQSKDDDEDDDVFARDLKPKH